MSALTDVELFGEEHLYFSKLESIASIEVVIIPDLIDNWNDHLAFLRFQELLKCNLVLSSAPAFAETQVLHLLFEDAANDQNNLILTHWDDIILVKVKPHDSFEFLVRDGLIVAELFDHLSDDLSEPWHA